MITNSNNKRRHLHSFRSPQKVLTALFNDFQSEKSIDLDQYVTADTLAIDDHAEILFDFLGDVEEIKIIHRQLCNCQIHYWLGIQIFDDAEDIIHAMIRFEREMIIWKITDIIIPYGDESTEEVQLGSIFGKEAESGVEEAV